MFGADQSAFICALVRTAVSMVHGRVEAVLGGLPVAAWMSSCTRSSLTKVAVFSSNATLRAFSQIKSDRCCFIAAANCSSLICGTCLLSSVALGSRSRLATRCSAKTALRRSSVTVPPSCSAIQACTRSWMSSPSIFAKVSFSDCSLTRSVRCCSCMTSFKTSGVMARLCCSMAAAKRSCVTKSARCSCRTAWRRASVIRLFSASSIALRSFSSACACFLTSIANWWCACIVSRSRPIFAKWFLTCRSTSNSSVP
mmetsp:Transcript_36301/g.104475  ORF Transcript_36301/g.104475 Transcript_36301/m.104475 type:complete len:255 (-) Transcript_36301:419-1183(-)